MREYIVYRHGWDQTNQSPERGLPDKMAVERIEADSAAEACRLAGPRISLSVGQFLSAEPADEVDAKETDLNRKAEAVGGGPPAAP